MNIAELKAIKFAVLAQPQEGEPKHFRVTDFPPIKDLCYEDRLVQPKDDYSQATTSKVWSFTLRGKWQPDTDFEIESDEQELVVSGFCNSYDDPENCWSLVGLAIQKGNGLVIVKPNAIFYKHLQEEERKRDDELYVKAPCQWQRVVTCKHNDVLPVTEEV